MSENKMFENDEELRKAHESEKFPGSNDIGMSASVSGIGTIKVLRPKSPGDMYSLYFENSSANEQEEVAFITGSTRIAEQEFAQITTFLRSRSWKSWDEAKIAVREYIVKLHGGLAK